MAEPMGKQGERVDESARHTDRTAGFWTRRRRLWAGGTAVAMGLLAAGGYWLPDWGLRYGLVRALHDLGWPRVSVSAAGLSLFNGAIVVREVQVGDGLERMLGIDGLDLTFRWKPLFSRRVSVERLDLAGVNIDIRRQGDEVVVNGLPLAVAGGDGSGSSWTYDVTTLTLTGSRIHLTDGTITADIEVERLEVADVKSWEPALPVRYRLTGRLNGAPIAVEGTATPFAQNPEFAARLSLGGFDLAGIASAVQAAGAGAVSGRLDADVALAGAVGKPLTASGNVAWIDGNWADNGTKVAAARLGLAIERLTWTGDRVDLVGKAESTGLRVEDGGVAFASASARLAARSAAWDGKTMRLSWDGTLAADRHSIAVDDIRIEHGSLDWDGATRFDFAAQQTSYVQAEGRAEAGDMRVAVGDMVMEAKRLHTQGSYQHARPEGMLPPLAGRMDITANQVSLRAPGQDWLQAERIEARDLRLAPGATATLGRAEARALAVLARSGRGGYPWRLEARQAVVERASLGADGAMAATSLALSGAQARVTRTKTGFLGLPEPSDAGAKTGAAQARLALGRLRVDGGSRIDFEDRSLGERVRLRLDGVELSATELDSARPDHDSPFIASARIGAAQISATGRARPFAEVPGGEVKGEVRALDLPPLSPYAADALGVHLQTGQLDADLSLRAIQGKLDGAMQLTLSELFIAQPDPNAPLAKSADMPVETVLDLLRGSDNRIRLSIPVRGDLANPDFDVSDAVGQAVGGALKSTVFTTLKVAFPLAGLISLVIDDAESRRLALEPLGFAPGEGGLGEAEQKRLQAVAELMTQHPNLRLTLCGVATQEGDGPAVERKRLEDQGLLARLQKLVGSDQPPSAQSQARARDRLVQLADARAQAAKAFLVEDAGIDPGRLFTCRPRVEPDAQAVPRVDLVL